MEWAALGDETAKGCGYRDAFSEDDQFRSESDISKEDAGAVEETQMCEMDWDRRRAHFAEACDEAAALFRLGVAQELECDVPGIGRHPAEAVAARP